MSLDPHFHNDTYSRSLAADTAQAISLLKHAHNRLFYAQEADSPRVSHEQAHEADDAIMAAARLAPEPHCTALLRLRGVLIVALHESLGMHPSGQELAAVDAALDIAITNLERES